MTDEAKTHTQGEVDMLIAIERVATLQCIMTDDFRDHKKEDDSHFSNLFNAEKEVLLKIDLIPQKINDCSNQIKKDILVTTDNRYTSITDFKVFRTQVFTSIIVGTVVGSGLATIASLLISAYKVTG